MHIDMFLAVMVIGIAVMILFIFLTAKANLRLDKRLKQMNEEYDLEQ